MNSNGHPLLLLFFWALPFFLCAQTHDCPPFQTPPSPTESERPSRIFAPGLSDPTGVHGPASVAARAPYPDLQIPRPDYPLIPLPENDPVDYLTGNFQESEADLQLQTLGRPFSFRRYYNSLSHAEGAFGPKWMHSFEQHLSEQPDGTIALETPGGELLFTRQEKDSALMAPIGYPLQLQRLPNGNYELLKPQGDRLTFNARGRLIAIGSPDGYSFQLLYSGEDRLVQVVYPMERILRFRYDTIGLLTQIEDPIGRTVRYHYDSQHRLVRVVNPQGQSKTYTYDRDHLLTSITDYNGETYRYEYKWDGRLLRSTDPLGHTERFRYPNVLGLFPINKTVFYDKNGKRWDIFHKDQLVRKVKNPLGEETRYEYAKGTHLIEQVYFADKSHKKYAYDKAGRLTAVTDALGAVTRYRYYGEGRQLSSVTNRNGQVDSFRYDSKGRLTSWFDRMEKATRYSYNRQGWVDTIRHDGELVATFQYDGEGNLIERSKRGRRESFTYDLAGNLRSYSDARDQRYELEYLPNGELAALIDPQNGRLEFRYDHHGQLVELINSLGEQYCFQYDRLGRLVSIADPASGVHNFHYDPLDNLLSRTDAAGHTWRYAYDPLQRLRQFTDPLGHAYRLGYDRTGNLISLVDPKEQESRFFYDQGSRLRQVLLPPKIVTTYTYDAEGNLTSATNANGSRTRYDYDDLYRLIRVISPMGYPTRYYYDAAGHLTGYMDANGNHNTLLYNDRGELAEEVDPFGNRRRFEYDRAGNLVLLENASADSIHFAYGPGGQLSSQSLAGATDQFEYNRQGRLASAGNDNLRYRYQYDAHGRMLVKEWVDWQRQLEYEYDENGRLAKRCDEAGTTRYRYDAAGQLTAITSPEELELTFSYFPDGRLARQTYPNGSFVTYTYFPSGLMRNMTIWKSTESVFASYDYSYDQMGNKLAITRDLEIINTFLYDRDDNLILSGYEGGVIEQFTYDSVGNRLTRQLDKEVSYYSYDKTNRLIRHDSAYFHYDANGNLQVRALEGDSTFYRYDDLNRLQEVVLPDGSRRSFRYDPFGLRISSQSAGDTTFFLYDRGNLLCEFDEKGKVDSRYTTGLEPDEVYLIHRDSTYYVVHRDPNGNVLGISDTAANLVNVYEYASFGTVIGQDQNVPNHLLFNSREYDELTGLYYFRNRFYEPTTGRFLTRDPFAGFAADPLSLNQYVFAYNNPLKFNDPMGASPGSRSPLPLPLRAVRQYDSPFGQLAGLPGIPKAGSLEEILSELSDGIWNRPLVAPQTPDPFRSIEPAPAAWLGLGWEKLGWWLER